MITFTLLVIGGLNWLLIAVTPGGWDIGQLFGGQTNIVSRVIYLLVGLAALIELFAHGKNCKLCGMKREMGGGMSMGQMPR